MTLFDDVKPRTGASEAKKRAKDVSKLLRKLMDTKDEKKFRDSLEKDFGITPSDSNYEEIISVWKTEHDSPE